MKTILRNWMVPEPRGAGDEGNPTPLTGGQVIDSKELSSLSLLPSLFSSGQLRLLLLPLDGPPQPPRPGGGVRGGPPPEQKEPGRGRRGRPLATR